MTTTKSTDAAEAAERGSAMQAFKIGDMVANYPLGIGRTDVVVSGVIAGIYEDGFLDVAAMHDGEYVRFVADTAKTRKAGQ